ncbi:MAG TPA: phage minor head protein [Crocinitomicaceae bacterium]|nr:phage minor head protein [Crocinitomicaceae bacterium]
MSATYNLDNFRPVAVDTFSDDEVKRIAKQFYDGNGKPVNKEIWEKNFKNLNDAIDKSYSVVYDEQDVRMNYELRNNVAVFAAFKSWRMGNDVSKLLTDKDGNKRQWGDFLKQYEKTNKKYNRNWLSAEYALAGRQANAARMWQDFERDADVYPNLKYMPSQSPEPRLAHQQYYGIVKPIGDKFWNTNMPPSDWGCKCSVEQTMDEPTDHIVPERKLPKGIIGNPGKTGMIFSPDHPYIPKEKKNKQAVKEGFNQLRASLDNEYILYHGDKGTVSVSLNADPDDYLENFGYAKTVSKKYDGAMEVRPHYRKKGSNPELDYNGTIGDRTEWKDAKTVKNFVSNSFFNKLEEGKQLSKFDETFIALDFAGKLNKENLNECADHLIGQFEKYKSVKYAFLKQGDKVVMIKPGYDTKYIVRKIKQGLLNE